MSAVMLKKHRARFMLSALSLCVTGVMAADLSDVGSQRCPNWPTPKVTKCGSLTVIRNADLAARTNTPRSPTDTSSASVGSDAGATKGTNMQRSLDAESPVQDPAVRGNAGDIGTGITK